MVNFQTVLPSVVGNCRKRLQAECFSLELSFTGCTGIALLDSLLVAVSRSFTARSFTEALSMVTLMVPIWCVKENLIRVAQTTEQE